MKRSVRRVLALGIVALLGATLLSSCGDDEERLSKADFTKKLSALCKKRDKGTKVLDETNFFNMKQGVKTWTTVKGVVDDYVDAVKDLNPPEDADAMMDRYRSDADAVQSEIDDAIDAAKDRQQKSYSQAMGALFNSFSVIDKKVDAYGAKDCFDEEQGFPQTEKPAPGATVVEIGAKEYAFDIPTDIKAGKTAFKLVNHGNELHIFGFGKLKEGATFQQVKDAIARGDEDPGLLENEGITGTASPDGSVTNNTELGSGSYVAYCFLPAPDGTPHLAKGMLVQFEVA